MAEWKGNLGLAVCGERSSRSRLGSEPSARYPRLTVKFQRDKAYARSLPPPINGILVAIKVMNWTFASSGRFAMYTTASATCRTSMRGSTNMFPFACGTPAVIRCVISVAAFPISIWLHTMSQARPSREIDLVSPVIACLVAVYGAESDAARAPRSSRY